MKRKVLIGSVMAAFLVLVGVGYVAAVQLLTNGGAETGDTTGWAVTGDFGAVTWDGGTGPYAGSYFFSATATDAGVGNNTSMSQYVSVAGYHCFRAQGFYYVADTNDFGQVKVNFFDGGGGWLGDETSGSLPGPGGWNSFLFRELIPPGAVTAEYYVRGTEPDWPRPANAQVFFDQLRFDAWPINVDLQPASDWNLPATWHYLDLWVSSDGPPYLCRNLLDVHVDVTGANPTSYDTGTDTSGYALLDLFGANPGMDTIYACADLNSNQACDADEPYDTATKYWWLTPIVDPLMDYNYVDTYHTVTVDIGVELDDIRVFFKTAGANPISKSAKTDNGEVTFTYLGVNPGMDDIEVCVDINDNRECDDDDYIALARKHWIEPWEEPIVEEFVPEPGTMVLLGSGLMGLAGYATMRFRKKR